MNRNLFTLILLVSFISNIRSQTIQGFVTDTSFVGIYGVRLQAISQNDTTKRKDTLTDFSGFYKLKDIVTGINDIPGFSGDKMTITYEGGQMRINVTTNQNIENGKLYNIAGQSIAGAQFQRVGSNEFQAIMNIPNVPEQVLLFSDGVHPAKKIIPGMLPNYGSQTIDLSKSQSENSSLKGARVANNENTFIFRLDDNPEVDEYQPLEVEREVDMDFTNYFDFEMEKWPEFFANLYFNLKDKFGNIQSNTDMNVNSLDGNYSFNIQTDNNGDAQITDISINPTANKLIPDSVDFAVEIPENDYLEMAQDTLWRVSQGDIIKNYHNLNPKQQEFLANLYATIVSEQTGEPLENVLTEVWRKGSSDTTKINTNALGEADFENLQIPALNEITPDTAWHYIRMSGTDLETKLDSARMTNGTYNKTYQVTENEIPPDPKDYAIIINSKDGEGNNLPGVNWLVLSSDSTLIGQGNTQSNSLDTLLFQNTNPNLDIILKTNKTEHEDYRIEANVIGDQESLFNTINTLKTYLYEVGVVAKDIETGVALDSINVDMYLNGQLLMNGNSLQDTIANLNTIQPGHSLDLKALITRNGYIDSDSIPITINEGQLNQLVHELEKVPAEQKYSIIRRRIKDPLNQLGTTADIIVYNNEFNYSDTILSQPNMVIWADTVPVNSSGITEYNIKIIPHVEQGNIPLYTEEKTASLQPDQTQWEEDLLRSLEQEFILKGTRKTSDNGNAGELEVIFTETDGTVHSTTTNNGQYRLGPFPVGITGDIDFKITGADTTNYFSHTDIPVGGEYNIRLGTVPVKDILTNFKDSVLVYNPNMIQKEWTYPVNSEVQDVKKEDLKTLEGTSYNAPWSYWNEVRVYNTPNSDNPDWPTELGNFIQTHTGLPYNIIVVDTPRGTAPQVDLNDPEYMESIRGDMGINAESLTGTAGYTVQHSGGFSNNLGFNSTADITFRAPEQGQQVADYTYASGMRELLGRFGRLSEIGTYKSFMGGALPSDITISDMTRDFTNVNIIYKNMDSRTKGETHTGLGTLTED